jgi:hypothetical protein
LAAGKFHGIYSLKGRIRPRYVRIGSADGAAT